jgi:hypothetical protein
MRKIAVLLAMICLVANYGCIAYILGEVAGTIVRLPVEMTDEMLQGFSDGVFGTYGESDDSYTSTTKKEKTPEEPKKALIRDKRGNIVF